MSHDGREEEQNTAKRYVLGRELTPRDVAEPNISTIAARGIRCGHKRTNTRPREEKAYNASYE